MSFSPFPGASVGKDVLRAWARQTRAGLDLPILSDVIVRNLARVLQARHARNVLLYLPMSGEVEVERLLSQRKVLDAMPNWYVPRCAPGRRLVVHPYRPGETPLRLGPWGIREPDPVRVAEADVQCLDLVIVPALLLTGGGDRLGYGGGYYDRLLPRLSPQCHRVGALPSALIVPELPVDAWDVRLDAIVTE